MFYCCVILLHVIYNTRRILVFVLTVRLIRAFLPRYKHGHAFRFRWLNHWTTRREFGCTECRTEMGCPTAARQTQQSCFYIR